MYQTNEGLNIRNTACLYLNDVVSFPIMFNKTLREVNRALIFTREHYVEPFVEIQKPIKSATYLKQIVVSR